MEPETKQIAADPLYEYLSLTELEKMEKDLEKDMRDAAIRTDFIEAAQLRDQLLAIKEKIASLK